MTTTGPKRRSATAATSGPERTPPATPAERASLPAAGSGPERTPPTAPTEGVSPPAQGPGASAPSAGALATSSRRGSRLVSVAIASALFMEFIDSTALSTALPTLARAFETDPLKLKLALTSYILALAVFAPASGWVADRFGPKRVFMGAMAVFLAGSVLCGWSRSLAALVACRLLQGVGGAMMTPVARLIIVSTTPRGELVSSMAWFTMPALAGPLLGPPLAGLVLGVADWPWIFYLNVPACLAGLAAIARLVPSTRPPHPGPFDARGFAYAALAISALVGATETLGVEVVPRAAQAAGLVAALVAGGAYVRHARRAPRPVLDLTLFRLPTFRASLAGGTIVRLGIGAGPLLLPLLLQVALGWTPLKAGLVSLWQSVGALGAKPAAPVALRRYGFRTVLVATVLGAGVLTALPGFFRPGMPAALLVAVFAVGGFVRSNQFTAANAVAYADVPPERVSAASTLVAVTQQVGLSLGISFGGAVLHLAGDTGGALTPERFTAPYLAVGAVTLLALPIYARLPAGAGASLRGGAGGALAARGGPSYGGRTSGRRAPRGAVASESGEWGRAPESPTVARGPAAGPRRRDAPPRSSGATERRPTSAVSAGSRGTRPGRRTAGATSSGSPTCRPPTAALSGRTPSFERPTRAGATSGRCRATLQSGARRERTAPNRRTVVHRRLRQLPRLSVRGRRHDRTQ